MKSFEGLKPGDKVIDLVDKVILRYTESFTHIGYFTDGGHYWILEQFFPVEFEPYNGDLPVGAPWDPEA